MEKKMTLLERLRMTNQASIAGFKMVLGWCKDHKADIIKMIPVFIGTTIEVVDIVVKYQEMNHEKKCMNQYVYERSAGHYHELNRRLRASEWRMIDARSRGGESIGDILKSMGLVND